MTYWVPKPRPQCRQTVETHWENLHNLHMKHDQHCTHTTPKIEDVRTLFPNEVTELLKSTLDGWLTKMARPISFSIFLEALWTFRNALFFANDSIWDWFDSDFGNLLQFSCVFIIFPFLFCLKKECKSQNMGQIVIFWEETLIIDYKLSFLKRR